jgi:hypothetical protein
MLAAPIQFTPIEGRVPMGFEGETSFGRVLTGEEAIQFLVPLRRYEEGWKVSFTGVAA